MYKRFFFSLFLLLFMTASLLFYLFSTQTRIPANVLLEPLAGVVSLTTAAEVAVTGDCYLSFGEWINISFHNGGVSILQEDGTRITTQSKRFSTSVHLASLFKRQLLMRGAQLVETDIQLHLPERSRINEGGSPFTLPSLPTLSFLPVLSTGEITAEDISFTVLNAETKETRSIRADIISGRLGTEPDELPGMSSFFTPLSFRQKSTSAPVGNAGEDGLPCPFVIQVHTPDFLASAGGHVRIYPGFPRLEIDFTLSGNYLGTPGSPSGGIDAAGIDFSVKGLAGLTEQGMKVQVSTDFPGAKEFELNYSLHSKQDDKKYCSLTLQAQRVDIDEIQNTLNSLTASTEPADPQMKKDTITRDTVILPAALPFHNGNLTLDVRLLKGMGKRLENLSIQVPVKEGVIDKAPFSATVEKLPVTGTMSFAQGKSGPAIALELAAETLHSSPSIEKISTLPGVRLQAGQASTNISAKGITYGDLLDSLQIEAVLKNSTLFLGDDSSYPASPITLHQATFNSAPGKGAGVHAKGEVDNKPIDISLRFAQDIFPTLPSTGSIPFSAAVTLAGIRLEAEGKVPSLFNTENLTLSYRLTADGLSSINSMIGIPLPETGPFAITGSLRKEHKGYHLRPFQLEIGQTVLKGDMLFDTDRLHPGLTANLFTDVLQLENFTLERISSAPRSKNRELMKTITAPQKKKTLQNNEKSAPYRINVKLQAKRILTGDILVGSGNLTIEQQGEKIRIQTRLNDEDQGMAKLFLTVTSYTENRHYVIDAEAENFSYGPLLKHFQPGSKGVGKVHLRSFLTAKSPEFKSIIENAVGYIDLSFHPKKLGSGSFDLWCFNFFNYLVPFFTSKNESVINCAAGRFNVENGIMKEEDFLVDTTETRIGGSIEVDFLKDWIEATLYRSSKQPKFLGSSIPITIQGSLLNFETGIPVIGAVVTTIGDAILTASYPLQWLLKKRVPVDGSEDCLQLYNARPHPAAQDDK